MRDQRQSVKKPVKKRRYYGGKRKAQLPSDMSMWERRSSQLVNREA